MKIVYFKEHKGCGPCIYSDVEDKENNEACIKCKGD